MPIDMSAVKAPPARKPRSTGNTPASSKTPASSPAISSPEGKSPLNAQRFEGLMGLASLGQGICLMAGLHADAATIGKMFPPVAQEVANIADDNESVAGPIDFVIKIGPYGALLAAAMPFVMQILANHKVVDPVNMGGFGVVPPEVLEAQMRAQMLRTQAEAMQAQKQAIHDANEAAAAYAKMMQPPAEATT